MKVDIVNILEDPLGITIGCKSRSTNSRCNTTFSLVHQRAGREAQSYRRIRYNSTQDIQTKNSITSPSEGFLCRSSHRSTQLNKGYISIRFSSPRGFLLLRVIPLLFRFSCSFHHLSVSPTLGGFLS